MQFITTALQVKIAEKTVSYHNTRRKTMNEKTILIGADIVPTEPNIALFESGEAEKILTGGLYEVFKSADYKIFNLECPLSDISEPILKSGPNLMASRASINGYRAMGIDLLCLANNHTLDQGKAAFADTVANLKENGFSYIGGGLTYEEVHKPHTFTLGGLKFGVINFCEHEFSWFEDYGIGANGFDPLYSLDEVSELKNECDYVIALYHGGREHYRYPSPELSRICRRIAEKGADLVICQHTHCVGAGENWGSCEIIYGQGNTVFSREGVAECWDTSILVRLSVKDGKVSLGFIPIERTDIGAKISDNPEILDGYKKRSEEIKKPGAIKEIYLNFVRENADVAIGHLSYFSEATNKGTRRGAACRNIINCSPHREMLVTYLTELHELK